MTEAGQAKPDAPKRVRRKKTECRPEGRHAGPAAIPRKNSRNRLGDAFLAALQADFLEHGAQVIAALRDKAPGTYVNTVAGLLPKDVKAGEERELSDDELLDRIRQLDAIIAPLLRPQGTQAPGGDA